MGAVRGTRPSAAMGTFIQGETVQWAKVVEESGTKLE